MKLRPYQLEAVDRVRRFLRAGVKRVLLVAPTGAGKTVIASHITTCSTDLGNRVLFLAHRRELISQAFRKMIGCTCRAGYEHDSLLPDPECRGDGLSRKMVGVVMANDPRRNPAAVVQVASVDTIRNRAKPHADLGIIDEAHRSLARSYGMLFAAYPDAAWIGLTATPYRADNRSLGEEYDEVVVVATPRQLIDDGFLVEPLAFTVPAKDLPDLSRVRIKGGEYDIEELGVAMDDKKLVGDIVDHWRRRAENRQTVVFATNVDHSRHIAARFVAAGIPAEHLDANTPTPDRDAILARLERGETRVVTNCDVLSEGWDQPIVKCCILAAPTKSKGKYLQRAGRILRPCRGITALILDHAGCVLEHGLPQETQDFSDILNPKPKKKVVKSTTKTCPACFALLPISTRICGAPKTDGTLCDYEFLIAIPDEDADLEEKDGELVEVRPATMEEKRADWDALCQQAIAKGYKPGWAKHQFKNKYGTWPPNSFPFPERPRPPATDDEKRAKLEQLRETSAAKGYKPGWIKIRYRAEFGEDPPAEWLAPKFEFVDEPLAMVSGDDFYAAMPEHDEREEWPF